MSEKCPNNFQAMPKLCTNQILKMSSYVGKMYEITYVWSGVFNASVVEVLRHPVTKLNLFLSNQILIIHILTFQINCMEHYPNRYNDCLV